MDIYSLVVESFTIHDTRSAINDTLWLNVSAFVDGDMGRFMVGEARRFRQRDAFSARVRTQPSARCHQ